MTVHARLDREVSRFREDADPRISESFINGIEFAATIAYRAENALPVRDWWIDIDGHGEPHVWMPGTHASRCIISQSAAGPELWALLSALVPERIVEDAATVAVEKPETEGEKS